MLGHRPVDEIVPIEPATHGSSHRHPVGQVRRRQSRPVQGRPLGTRSAHLHSPCVRSAARAQGSALEIATVPAEDEATYDMVSKGDTVGVFQIESRAQMAMLASAQPTNLLRPGDRSRDRASRSHPGRHGAPVLASAKGRGISRAIRTRSSNASCSKTLGVPIFQEQVMKLAVEGGRLHGGRSRPAAARHGRLAQGRAGSRSTARGWSRGCSKQGIPEEFAERVFSQIRGFGEYGFPESHAASFALLAYVTAWLRLPSPRGVRLRDPERAADGLLQRRRPWSRTPSGTAWWCSRWTSTRAAGTAPDSQ